MGNKKSVSYSQFSFNFSDNINVSKLFRHINVEHKINMYISNNEIFNKIILPTACKILNNNDLVQPETYYNNYKYKCYDIYVHPILVKSILRYLDAILSPIDIYKEINVYHNSENKICSLLHIIDNIPTKIITNGLYNTKLYSDKFNDDKLMNLCSRNIFSTMSILPSVIMNIIINYI